jgi:hypothetical protein
VAQLGARLDGIEEVVGSNPIGSTNSPMRHFVQYHNAEKMRPYDSSRAGLGIVTNKVGRALPVPGDRIWLVTGEGRPRRYLLCSWFDVSKIVPKRLGSFGTEVTGEKGQNLKTFLPLDSKSWFPRFRKKCGNFGRGLVAIEDQAVISDLRSMI